MRILASYAIRHDKINAFFIYLAFSIFRSAFSVTPQISVVIVTSRHGDHPIDLCSKHCNKCVFFNLFAGDLKTLKRQMKRKNISMVVSAGEKVCFCVFDSTLGPDSRRGEKLCCIPLVCISIQGQNMVFFSLFID